jgi:hypothetical protein
MVLLLKKNPAISDDSIATHPIGVKKLVQLNCFNSLSLLVVISLYLCQHEKTYNKK